MLIPVFWIRQTDGRTHSELLATNKRRKLSNREILTFGFNVF